MNGTGGENNLVSITWKELFELCREYRVTEEMVEKIFRERRDE
tara:strand:- start:160 stop:288 length:129 start_codon:yes stop_codon:yes gene_type:complete